MNEMNKHLTKNRTLIKKFVLTNKDNFSIQLKRKYKRIFREVDKLSGKNFSEKMYKFLNPKDGECVVCKKNCYFISTHKGYSKTCSMKCRDIIREEKCREFRKCKICNTKFKVYKKRKKSCCSDECTKKLSISKEVCDKRVESVKNYNHINYGVDFFVQTEEFVQKSKKTKLKKYGDENFVNTEKVKQTKLKKYGDENYNNPNKMKKTCLEKYGVDNFSKTLKFKENFYEKVLDRITDFNVNLEPLFNFKDYNGVDDRYKFKCKKCNRIFEYNLNNGRYPYCYSCEPNKFSMQTEVDDFIKSFYSGIYNINDRKILSGKELDFYFPDEKIAIEFNGIYWHSELSGNKDKHYHLNKTKLCEEKNIQLIHIFENEWLTKNEIIKTKIKHIFKVSNLNKIYARKCNVREIDSKTKNEFLNKTHIQGEDKSKIKLGAFYNDELIAVMTFGSLRISLGQKNKKLNEYELIRFSSSVHCVGIASKLLTHFIKKYSPNKIITYADKRYSVGNLYEKLNFKHIGNSVPNYWYFVSSDRNKKLFHRFKFRKDQLPKLLENFDPSLSEWKNMQMNGFDRIWDCGNLKYEWIRK